MVRMPQLRSGHLLPFARVLNEHGEPSKRLVQRAGLPSRCLDDPRTLVPARATGRFRELAAQKLGMPNIALAAVEPLEVSDLGDFGRALLGASTLHEALHELCRLTPTQTSGLRTTLVSDPGGDLYFRLELRFDAGAGEWHLNLYTLCLMLKVVRLADPGWSPGEISMTSAGSASRTEAVEALGGTPRFAHPHTGFLVPASMLAVPLTGSSEGPAQEDLLWENAPSETCAGAVRQMLQAYVDDEWLGAEQIAQVNHISLRGLQRALKAEGTTFRKILEETRGMLAEELLRYTDATMSDIAQRLGYQHQGDFTRAFKHWAGVSPQQYRQQHKAKR